MKSKNKLSFVCQECGYDSPQWLGKCPECGMWNSMKEIRVQPVSTQSTLALGARAAVPTTLSAVSTQKTMRVSTTFNEFDTVLGGGLVPGGVMLLAGDPGVGKSTLVLQLALRLGQEIKGAKESKETKVKAPSGTSVSSVPFGSSILYISGEESIEQVKMRAERLLAHPKTDPSMEHVFLLAQTDIDQAVAEIEKLAPALVVVDSIQTMQSVNVAGLSGSVPQIRYATLQLVRIAKQLSIPIIIVGHVTKDGMVAGPMVLSHMVDTVLFLEGEKFSKTRLLRSLKNRFGPVDEVGVFSMEEEGLAEVKDPSQLFLSNHKQSVPGSVLVVTMEGSRAFLVEIQALVVTSRLPMPRRVASGVDQRRLELLLAVLQKHCRLPVDTADVFVNVAGGMKLSDPAADAAICLAVYASMKNVPLSQTVGIAEVGLLGELRRVPSIEKRIKEAKQFGFTRIISSLTHHSLAEVIRTLEK